jgi:hypothetical protein
MTHDELNNQVWHELPAFMRLAGRSRVDRIVARTLKSWPVAVMAQCDPMQSAVVTKYLARSIERAERREVGMGFFASIILAALVSEIVKILLRRWLENRTAMMELVK